MKKKEVFSTKDVKLATFLSTKGIPLVSVDAEEYGSGRLFVFEKSDEAQELEELYKFTFDSKDSRMKVNVKDYEEHRRRLIDLAKN